MVTTLDTSLQKELLTALDREFKFRREGAWLRKGKCPSCGKSELFTHGETPRVLKCGRLNRCGYERSVKDYFPEIFDDWSKRFKATDNDPNAAADAYLSHARGLDLRGMRDCYSQEYFKDPARDIGSATVRFPLPDGGWWERIIDQPGRFDRKARFCPGKSYQGHWWMPPDLDWPKLATATSVWICEGIFDAWALRQAGHVAVSAMTVNNWPKHALASLRTAISQREDGGRGPELIFAFDVGAAGLEYTRKYVARARDEGWAATAAQVRPEGDGVKLDWNDLLLRERLGPDDIAEYLWNGQVAIAPSATEKACLIYERRQWVSFSFNHESRTWWASFSPQRIAEVKAKENISDRAAIRSCAQVTEIANCAFRTLYRERDEQINETNFYLRVDFPGTTPTAKSRFSSGQLTAAPEFKKRLFDFGGMFTGSTGQLDRLMQVQTKDLKTVEPIDFTGFSISHGAWILGDLAVKGGRVHQLNNEDYFDFGKVAVKLRTAERLLTINYDADANDLEWLPHLWTAFGPKGLVVLAFWIMAGFAEQIREKYVGLGFLEVNGEGGSGKSTLAEFCWKLYGRARYEGFDPSKATSAAIARHLGKVANMPVVLIEAGRREEVSHARKFEWEELLTAFNGRSVRSRGVRSGGMETYDPPFRAAIAIIQNEPVDAIVPLLERITRLKIDKSGHSAASVAAAKKLEHWPMERVSGFMVHLWRQEEAWLKAFHENYATHMATLPEISGIQHLRLLQNHCHIAAALDATASLIRIPADWLTSAHSMIVRILRERHEALSADHPIVASFWEAFDWLEANEGPTTSTPINLHRDANKIAISLNYFEERCRARGLSSPPLDKLKHHLRGSKSRRFITAGTVNTVIDKGIHCWVFEAAGASGNRKETRA